MESNQTKLKQLLMHVLIWLVFAYCYNSAINLVVKMALDANAQHQLLWSISYCLGFTLLTAHLITKYDKVWPITAGVVITVIGLVVIPAILFGAVGLLAWAIIISQILFMPIACFAMIKYKEKVFRPKS